MEKDEPTRTCGECHKEVAVANFALHEMHCRRFLIVCPDCTETVPREQLKQHREEEHTQVKCSKCNKKVERCKLINHESDECVERLQSCQFCELQLPWKALDKHQHVCGSRTELCSDCGRYVTLRDQPEHSLTCSAADSVSGSPQPASTPPANKTTITVSCDKCMTSFPAKDKDKHELVCVPVARFYDEENQPEDNKRKDDGYFSKLGAIPRLSSAYKATSLSDRVSRDLWDDGGALDQISICPHCHLALPLLTLRWHKVKCRIHILMK